MLNHYVRDIKSDSLVDVWIALRPFKSIHEANFLLLLLNGGDMHYSNVDVTINHASPWDYLFFSSFEPLLLTGDTKDCFRRLPT